VVESLPSLGFVVGGFFGSQAAKVIAPSSMNAAKILFSFIVVIEYKVYKKICFFANRMQRYK
jgi:hypothetical protein